MNFVSSPNEVTKGEVIIPYHGNDKLKCEAVAYPPPRITLFYDNKNLHAKQTNDTVTKEIRWATNRVDGRYCCMASNGEWNASQCLRVSVKANSSKLQAQTYSRSPKILFA